MTYYLISDYWAERKHWRTVGMTNSVAHAKAFASRDGIVTAHTFEEADQIHRTRVLPASALERIVA